MDRGEEPVPDEGERSRSRQLARRVHVQALLAAAVLTAVALVIP